MTLACTLDRFLVEHGERLLEEGFELRRRGRKIRRMQGFSFTVSLNMDWLDIRAEMVVENGETRPLHLDLERLEGMFLNL